MLQRMPIKQDVSLMVRCEETAGHRINYGTNRDRRENLLHILKRQINVGSGTGGGPLSNIPSRQLSSFRCQKDIHVFQSSIHGLELKHQRAIQRWGIYGKQIIAWLKLSSLSASLCKMVGEQNSLHLHSLNQTAISLNNS